MAINVITSVRHHATAYGLKGSYKLTMLELAHRMSSSGVGRVSYAFLAGKTGQSVRTMIRHLHRLVELQLVQKIVHRTLVSGKLVHGWNEYRWRLPLLALSRTATR